MSKDLDGNEGDNLEPTADDAAVDAGDTAGESSAPTGRSGDEPSTTANAAGIPQSSDDDADSVAADPDSSLAAEGDQEMVSAGAVVGAGSARAAARRAGAKTGVTPKKDAPTRKRDADESSGNIFSRIGLYLREVVSELRKVIWPSQKQMITYTIVVIIFLIFMVALIAGLDLLFHLGIGEIFG